MVPRELHFVVASDRRVLAGLHVSTKSVLQSLDLNDAIAVFHLFSEDLGECDLQKLEQTLERTDKPFRIVHSKPDVSRVKDFPKLSGSIASYFRLLALETLPVDRFVYFDTDTICLVNLRPLFNLDLNGHPLGAVAEAPMSETADVRVREHLGQMGSGMYFNTGVLVADVQACNNAHVTSKCLRFISEYGADYWDQSAINFVLHNNIEPIDTKFNSVTNVRTNWPSLRKPNSGNGTLMHFVGGPKPWHFLCRWLHPMGPLWWSLFRQTAAAGLPVSKVPRGRACGFGGNIKTHKLAIKDRLLLLLYTLGLLKPKAVP
ncbi:MAG: glycosyltransferase family 8 protein [Fuerstiella sp.]